jgi:prepilin-type N-terminal cleavage/methylation domain-containing protein
MSNDSGNACAGFTLIEALVAMALLLAFLSALVPHLFYARRIVAHLDDRIAAQAVLRSLLDVPIDRSALGNGLRDGEIDGLSWSVSTEPMFVDAMVPDVAAPLPAGGTGADAAPKLRRWRAFRLVATVSWGSGHVVSAETLKLGPAE